MGFIKKLSAKAPVGKILDYVTNEKKTDDFLITEKDCFGENALESFTNTKKEFNKNTGVQYHHIVQSFNPEDKIDPAKANQLGVELAEEIAKKHECVIVTHTDKNHIHNHIIINSVSFEDGKKYHSDRKHLFKIKEINKEICEREGLSVVTEKTQEIRETIAEKKIKEKGIKTWKDDLRNAIDEVKIEAKSLNDLKEKLKEKYNIETKIQNKNISFLHPEQQKFCRGNKLGNLYEKEYLNNFVTTKKHELNNTNEHRIKEFIKQEFQPTYYEMQNLKIEFTGAWKLEFKNNELRSDYGTDKVSPIKVLETTLNKQQFDDKELREKQEKILKAYKNFEDKLMESTKEDLKKIQEENLKLNMELEQNDIEIRYTEENLKEYNIYKKRIQEKEKEKEELNKGLISKIKNKKQIEEIDKHINILTTKIDKIGDMRVEKYKKNKTNIENKIKLNQSKSINLNNILNDKTKEIEFDEALRMRQQLEEEQEQKQSQQQNNQFEWGDWER